MAAATVGICLSLDSSDVVNASLGTWEVTNALNLPKDLLEILR
jgi:hypothetical protein